MADQNPGPRPGGAPKGYESRDLRPAAVLPWLAVLLVLVTGTLLVVSWIQGAFDTRYQREAGPAALLPTGDETHLEPHLQVAPARDLEEVRRAEQQILTSYEWIDRQNGVVRIPIERAVDLLLERGLPVRDKR